MFTEIIQSEESLLAIKNEWNGLSAELPQSTGFFASWDFVWNVVHTIKPNKWFVVLLREPEKRRLVAVFGWERLTLETPLKTYRAVQPLAPSLVPYVEFPVESRWSRQVLQVLLNNVLVEQLGVDVVCLWPLHEASPLYQTLTEDMRNDQLRTFRYPSNQSEIETRGLDFSAYCRSKPNSTFANARYRERRLRKEGELRFTLCEPLPEALGVAERLCLASEARFGTRFAYRAKPGWGAWVVEMVRALADQGVAQVSTLRLNEVVIASALSFWFKGRRYGYLTHYDPAYAPHSPGKILLHRLIEQTFADEGVLCFGAGSYRYKDDWAQSMGDLKAAFIFMNGQARQGLDSMIDHNFIVRLGQV